MNLNQLAISLIELDPGDTKGLSELIKNMEAAVPSSQGKTRELLNTALDTAKKIDNGDLKSCQDSLSRIGELLEQAMEGGHTQGNNAKGTALESGFVGQTKTKSFVLPRELDAELLAEFITENMEYVAQAESALLEWERDHGNKELLNTIFRAFHTIKGTASFINLDHIKEIAHQVESMLAKVRDEQADYAPIHADLSFKALDMLKQILTGLKTSSAGCQVPLPGAYDMVMAELSLGDNQQPVAGTGQPNAKPGFKEWMSQRREAAGSDQTAGNGKMVDDHTDSTVRVRIDRLDKLIDMVGELVIAQSMVTQDEAVVSGGHYDLAKKVSHAGKIVRELQDLSMYLRMVPLKATFQKLNRLARDLAHKNGKMVNFISEGAETEIDRNMVDMITDPLIHMIRNTIDHGIETPEERRKLGKSGDGRLCLIASHSEGKIMLQIQDDGRGLSRERIEKKAIERGMMDPIKKLSDQEAWQLIFQPGFTTAEKVTEVSGRGVGLDVVRKAVEELHGRIEIDSVEGQGCIFTLRMPLTMAITDGMVVSVGEEKYILPTANIQIAIRPRPHDIYTVSGRGEMLNFRDQMLPIFRLHRLFDVPGARTDATQGLLIIIGEGLRRCAILVDDLLAQSQVVTKSLGNGLEKVPGISGGAIMGDGRVGLIIDTTALIKFAQEGSSLK